VVVNIQALCIGLEVGVSFFNFLMGSLVFERVAGIWDSVTPWEAGSGN
jgi:hypothetical protein